MSGSIANQANVYLASPTKVMRLETSKILLTEQTRPNGKGSGSHIGSHWAMFVFIVHYHVSVHQMVQNKHSVGH